VGTSAGSVVGAQLATGVGLAALYAGQIQPPDPAQAPPQAADLSPLLRLLGGRPPEPGPRSPAACAEIGRLALAAATGPEADRLAVMRGRLPIREWPERRLVITAVEATEGGFVTWDRASGVPLLLAVASSCAVPLVYPPVTIDGRKYIDGGIRSATNADLAAGYQLVVVIAPSAALLAGRGPLEGEVAGLRAAGGRVEVLWPAAAAIEAIGPNALDPARREASARAGREQAAAHAGALREALGAA
jgi:NTE family protein